MHMRTKKWAKPELAICPYFTDEAESHRGNWRACFKKDQPLYLELGCGKGVSTAAMVYDNRDINFIAMDITCNVLGDTRRNIAKTFCNPWTKRPKYAKRRLTHPRQLMQYRDFLVDGGEIWFKTDDMALFTESLPYFKACGFEMRYLLNDLHAAGFEPNYVSEHELKFTGLGVPIKFVSYGPDRTQNILR